MIIIGKSSFVTPDFPAAHELNINQKSRIKVEETTNTGIKVPECNVATSQVSVSGTLGGINMKADLERLHSNRMVNSTFI